MHSKNYVDETSKKNTVKKYNTNDILKKKEDDKEKNKNLNNEKNKIDDKTDEKNKTDEELLLNKPKKGLPKTPPQKKN
jgi:hypothetical protein